MTKLVNEVYHMYNRHQYPFAALNIAVASGRKIAINHKWLFLNLSSFILHKCFWLCYFRVCGCKRDSGQAANFPSGGETLVGYSKDLTHQHV